MYKKAWDFIKYKSNILMSKNDKLTQTRASWRFNELFQQTRLVFFFWQDWFKRRTSVIECTFKLKSDRYMWIITYCLFWQYSNLEGLNVTIHKIYILGFLSYYTRIISFELLRIEGMFCKVCKTKCHFHRQHLTLASSLDLPTIAEL